MKKLLLLSLLVVGAKSFASIHVAGTTTDVVLPIRVSGNVINNDDAKLVIESNTTGMSGDEMHFVFNQVVKGGISEQNGAFTVKKADGSKLATAIGGSSDQIQVGFGEGFLASDTTATAGEAKVKIDYALLGGLEGNVYEGNIKVTVDASSGSVQPKSFEDFTKKLHVKYTPA